MSVTSMQFRRPLACATCAVTIAVLGMVASGHAAHRVRVESLSNLAPGSSNVSIGIYIENDQPILGIVLPIEIRACVGEAYLRAGVFSRGLNPAGRVANSPLGFAHSEGLWPDAQQTYRTFAIPGPVSNNCPRPHNPTNMWGQAAALPDYVSPEAVVLATFAQGDPMLGEQIFLEAGVDPPGVPSFLITCNVNDAEGAFLIDTTCIIASLHLYFVGATSQIVPFFQPGRISIGSDGTGACELDIDHDDVIDGTDNCPNIANTNQFDSDQDGIGDTCDCDCYCHANPDCSAGGIDIIDVLLTISIAFDAQVLPPDPSPTCPNEKTDVNCSGATDIVDVVRTVNVAFRNANAATEYCAPCP